MARAQFLFIRYIPLPARIFSGHWLTSPVFVPANRAVSFWRMFTFTCFKKAAAPARRLLWLGTLWAVRRRAKFEIFCLLAAVLIAGASGTSTTYSNVPLSRLILRCCCLCKIE
jgi:hypothetical protein